jgi:hypothetical protein
MRHVLGLCLLGLLLGAGCAPRPPLELKLRARTGLVWQTWQGRHADQLGPELVAELAGAVAEFRLDAMDRFPGSSSAALDAAVRLQLDGRPLREVLIHAHQLALVRHVPEIAELRAALVHNRDLEALDLESATRLDHHTRQLLQRLDAATARLNFSQNRLAALENRPAPSPP